MRDPIKSNQIIHYFIQNPKAHPLIPLFALMYNYFSKLALIHQAKGASDDQIAALIGVPRFVAKEYLQSARNYKLGKVIDVFRYIKEADLRSKGVDSGSMTDAEILRELVYKILH